MTKVPQKFRFPYFTELQWYALDKYAYSLLGRTHLELTEEEQTMLLGNEDERTQYLESLEQHHRHVTAQEIFGIKAIIMYIHALPVSKKNVPPLLKEPINLVRDIKLVVEGHKNDDPELSVTGQPLLHWPGIKNDKGYAKVRLIFCFDFILIIALRIPMKNGVKICKKFCKFLFRFLF